MTASPTRLTTDGTCALSLYSFAGGYADASGYLIAHSFTGHVTGNLVLFVIAAVGRDFNGIAHTVTAIVIFLAATALGQSMLAQAKGFMGKGLTCFITGVQIILVGASALAALHAGRYGALAMVACLCGALGLQNGIVNSIEGVSVHTTYLTGTITNMIKAAVKVKTGAQPIDKQRRSIRSELLVWAAFMAGAFTAALLIHQYGPVALLGLELPITLGGIVRIMHPQNHAL